MRLELSAQNYYHIHEYPRTVHSSLVRGVPVFELVMPSCALGICGCVSFDNQFSANLMSIVIETDSNFL